VVTNGLTHFAGRIDIVAHSFELLDHIPDYETIIRTEP